MYKLLKIIFFGASKPSPWVHHFFGLVLYNTCFAHDARTWTLKRLFDIKCFNINIMLAVMRKDYKKKIWIFPNKSTFTLMPLIHMQKKSYKRNSDQIGISGWTGPADSLLFRRNVFSSVYWYGQDRAYKIIWCGSRS